MPKAKRKPTPFDCTVMRTVLVTDGRLNMNTGEITEGKKEWQTKPCGTPLFTDKERSTSICRSCAKGWNHPDNYRADGPRPDKEING